MLFEEKLILSVFELESGLSVIPLGVSLIRCVVLH